MVIHQLSKLKIYKVLEKKFIKGKGSYKKIKGFKDIYINNLIKDKIMTEKKLGTLIARNKRKFTIYLCW